MRGGGGLVTSPDAQSELGRVQVHHIVPQEPVQHVYDHRLEHHFPQPRWTRQPPPAVLLPAPDLPRPPSRALGSPAPGRLPQYLPGRRTRTQPRALQGAEAATRSARAHDGLQAGGEARRGSGRACERRKGGCAAASLTPAPSAQTPPPLARRLRLLPVTRQRDERKEPPVFSPDSALTGPSVSRPAAGAGPGAAVTPARERPSPFWGGDPARGPVGPAPKPSVGRFQSFRGQSAGVSREGPREPPHTHIMTGS